MTLVLIPRVLEDFLSDSGCNTLFVTVLFDTCFDLPTADPSRQSWSTCCASLSLNCNGSSSVESMIKNRSYGKVDQQSCCCLKLGEATPCNLGRRAIMHNIIVNRRETKEVEDRAALLHPTSKSPHLPFVYFPRSRPSLLSSVSFRLFLLRVLSLSPLPYRLLASSFLLAMLSLVVGAS